MEWRIVSSILITLILLVKESFRIFLTQIIYYAFLRRIAKEKRQMDIRDKIIIEKRGMSKSSTQIVMMTTLR